MGTCMVPCGVLCDISLILDSEKKQAHHYDQSEVLNTWIIFNYKQMYLKMYIDS